MTGPDPTVAARAQLSRGTSGEEVYAAVAAALAASRAAPGVLLDVGAGSGGLLALVRQYAVDYVAVDAVRYPGLPDGVRFVQADLDRLPLPLADGSGDIVVAAEVIEHLENPRAFVRELARLARPGAWILVTTPNQSSFLSVLSLLIRRRFPAFSDGNYPAHLTALLPIDLVRIATETGLESVRLHWTRRGRIPGTAVHWPSWVSTVAPRLFSDNVLLIGRKRLS